MERYIRVDYNENGMEVVYNHVRGNEILKVICCMIGRIAKDYADDYENGDFGKSFDTVIRVIQSAKAGIEKDMRNNESGVLN